MEEPVITIGGKRFIRADLERRTVRQDHFMTGLFKKTGIDRITPTAEEVKDATLFMVRLHQKIITSGHACEILSGFLIPEGTTEKQWTVATARQVQEVLETADTEEDRLLVSQLAFEVMTGFFRRVLRSLILTLNYSGVDEASEPAVSPSTSETQAA